MLRGRFLQPFWTRVHGVALAGMNVGNDDQATNGELWLLERLATSLPPSPVVFDVGANVGRYSEAVLERMPGARLYAFEPSATAFSKLQASFGQRVRTFRYALGAENGEQPLYADRPGSELGSLIHRDLHRYGLAVGEQETVIVRRLDTLCAELDVERIDLLKIDAEGAELDVLRGAGDMLGTRIGVIEFEFGGTAIDAHHALRDFFDVLEPAYRIHRLLPGALWPLDYSERLEIFEYANYVALPKGVPSVPH
jgi:FkbM family methyltransferase